MSWLRLDRFPHNHSALASSRSVLSGLIAAGGEGERRHRRRNPEGDSRKSRLAQCGFPSSCIVVQGSAEGRTIEGWLVDPHTRALDRNCTDHGTQLLGIGARTSSRGLGTTPSRSRQLAGMVRLEDRAVLEKDPTRPRDAQIHAYSVIPRHRMTRHVDCVGHAAGQRFQSHLPETTAAPGRRAYRHQMLKVIGLL